MRCGEVRNRTVLQKFTGIRGRGVTYSVPASTPHPTNEMMWLDMGSGTNSEKMPPVYAMNLSVAWMPQAMGPFWNSSAFILSTEPTKAPAASRSLPPRTRPKPSRDHFEKLVTAVHTLLPELSRVQSSHTPLGLQSLSAAS